jgi:hypothetical protein
MSEYFATGYTLKDLKSMHPNITLKGEPMNNFYIAEEGWPQVHGEPSTVTFTTQSGPIGEFGVNGGQIDDVIEWAKEKIEGFNKSFPSRENAMVITKLDEALLWLVKRKLDREKRNVEGQNKL